MERKISVALTVDGTDAQRGYAQAARFAEQFGAASAAALNAATQATNGYTASVGQTTLAQQAQETAAQRFLSSLERENVMLGKTRDQQLELRAAMLGVSQAADPLIQQWRQITAAAQAAAAAEKQAADGAAFVASLNARASAIGKTSSQLLEMKAAELGVSAQAAPMIAKLRESEVALGRVGASAGQTAQAMRMLPAQLSDLTTQIASGQGFFTPLLQQGLQTRDMFGSFAAMFRGIAAAITPMVAGVAAAAVVLGTLTYGITAGYQETEALRTSLIATGNAAGMTVGQLSAMAERVGALTGNYGLARDAVQQLAATGRFSGQQLETALKGVVAGTAVTGKSVEDLVADFKRLGEDPSKTLAALSEQQNFLSASTYAQVAALEAQGKATEAATLAQQIYADTMASRKGQIVEDIGTVEKAWKEVKSAVDAVKEAIKSIGRPVTTQFKVDVLERISRDNEGELKARPNAWGFNREALAKREYLSEEQYADLTELRRKRDEENKKAAADAELVRIRTAGMEGVKLIDQQTLALDKSKAAQAEINRLARAYADTRASILREGDPTGELQKRISGVTFDAAGMPTGGGNFESQRAEILKKAIDKSVGAAGQNAISGQIAALRAQQQVEESALKASLDEQKKLRDTSVTDLQQFYDNQYTLRASSLDRQLAIAQKEVTAASGKNELAAREQAKGRVAKIQQEIEQNERQHAVNVQGIRDQYAENLGKQVGQWEEQKRAATDALSSENALYGKTDAQRRIAAVGLKVEAEARTFRNAQAEAGITVTEAEAKAFDEKTAAQRRSAEQAEADMQAASGAQALYEQNRQFAADAIIDERAHAAAVVDIERQKWQALIDAATEGSEEQKRLRTNLAQWEINQAQRPQIEAQRAAHRAMVGDWVETVDGIGEVFRDGFAGMLNGGKDSWKSFTKSLTTSFKTTVADVMYKMLAKPFVVRILAGAAGVLTGDSSVSDKIIESGGGGTDILSTGSKVLGNLFGKGEKGGPTATFGGNVSGMIDKAAIWGLENGVLTDVSTAILENSAAIETFANAAGDVLAYGGAIMAALNGQFGSAIGSAIGAAIGGPFAPITSFIGAQLGAMIDKMMMGEKRSGGTYALDGNGDAQFVHGPSGGQAGAGQGVKSAINATVASINETLKAVGSQMSVSAFHAAFEQSEKGRGGVMSGGQLSDGTAFGESGLGSNYKGSYYEFSSTQSPDIDTALKNFTVDLKQVTIQALQAATDVPKSIKAMVVGVDAEALTEEAVTALLTTISEHIQSIDKFRNAVMSLPFENLKKLSFDAAASLISLSGGIDQLSTNMTTYYSKFYTDEERAAVSLGQMTSALAMLGVQLPKTREGYRQIIEAQDVSTASGQLVVATMFEMGGMFDEWVTYTEGVVASNAQTLAAAKATTDSIWEAYYSAVFTDAEKLTRQGSLLGAAFAGLGVAMPKTVDDLKSLIDSQDPLTESGNKMREALAKLAPQFVDYLSNLEKTATVLPTAASKFEDALSNVQKATARADALLSTRNAAGSSLDTIDKALGRTAGAAAAREQQLWAAMQTASLEQQVDLAGQLSTMVLERYQTEKANLAQLVELGKSLRTYVQGLKVSDLSPLTLGQKLAEAGQQYQTTLKAAQGGDATAMAALQGQSQTYLELARRYYASGADYTKIFGSVTSSLDSLGASTQTEAQKQLAVDSQSLAQLEQLRTILSGAYTTLDRQYQQATAAAQAEMAGLEKIAIEAGRLQDVVGLLGSLPAELAAVLQPLLLKTNVDNWYRDVLGRAPDEEGKQWWENAQGAKPADFAQVAQRELALNAAYMKVLGRMPDAEGRDFWLKSGIAVDRFEAEIGKMAGVPGYARGGQTGTGLAWVGEEGPELIDIGKPSRVYSNDQLATAMRGGGGSGNAELVAEIRALNTRIGQLEKALVASQDRNGQAVAATVAASGEHVADRVGEAVNKGSFEASQRRVELV